MNKNIFCLLLLSSALQAKDTDLPLCSAKQCSDAEAGDECSCYCSVKCGPRVITEDDAPSYRYAEGDKEHKYGKRCFCAPRDVKLYKKNQCFDEKLAKQFEAGQATNAQRNDERTVVKHARRPFDRLRRVVHRYVDAPAYEEVYRGPHRVYRDSPYYDGYYGPYYDGYYGYYPYRHGVIGGVADFLGL